MNTLAIFIRTAMCAVLAISLGACDRADPLDPVHDLDAVSTQAKQQKALPFHGNTTGMLVNQTYPAPEDRCPPFRPILAEYHGTGTATHLGRITMDGGECMFFNPKNPGAVSSGEGRYRLTAANGDWMDVVYEGDVSLWFEAPTSPWIRWRVGLQVVEGSGRFQGAVFVGVTIDGGYNGVTQETYSTMDGKIIFDASVRSR